MVGRAHPAENESILLKLTMVSVPEPVMAEVCVEVKRPGSVGRRGSRSGREGTSMVIEGTTRSRRFRVAAGIGLVLAFSLRTSFLSGFMVAGLLRAVPSGNDPIRRSERRFRPVEAILPPRGVFGYRASGPLKVGKNHELEGDGGSIARYV